MSLGKPSPEMTALLQEMRCRGWTIYQWGPSADEEGTPDIVGATFLWDDGAADVAVIRSP